MNRRQRDKTNQKTPQTNQQKKSQQTPQPTKNQKPPKPNFYVKNIAIWENFLTVTIKRQLD